MSACSSVRPYDKSFANISGTFGGLFVPNIASSIAEILWPGSVKRNRRINRGEIREANDRYKLKQFPSTTIAIAAA
ncbi:unnamed protein product [Sphenostylis stenocarpa]|uniref:Uncharacterized protein n=1 Tax=Sphenostylis stenocarpa TaxID=92480 RepID=A0AA86S0N2_9FABA|nr:unnamed protein product [Sphenostylis stenocarpa]